jgi:hypothetical protein
MSHSIFKLKLKETVNIKVEYQNPYYIIHFMEKGEDAITGVTEDSVEFLEIILGRNCINKLLAGLLANLRQHDLDFTADALVEIGKIILSENKY